VHLFTKKSQHPISERLRESLEAAFFCRGFGGWPPISIEPFPLINFPRENQCAKNQFTPKAAKI